MPFANEHAARQTDPGKYERFRRENNKFGSGRDAIWGIKSDGTVELQSIRFKSSKHTPESAKKWLKEHNYKTGLEVATKKRTTRKRTTKKSEPEEVEKRITAPIDIAKIDDEQRLVFGWASVSEVDGKPVFDSDDDSYDTESLEKAAYDFIINAGVGSDMHKVRQVATPVESMFFSAEKQEALGIDLGKVGWWVGFRVQDDEVWDMIKSGDRPMLSIGGKARREEVAA